MALEDVAEKPNELPDGFAREFDLTALSTRWPEVAMQTSDPPFASPRRWKNSTLGYLGAEYLFEQLTALVPFEPET